MSRFAPPLTRLIDELRKLPGVGTKTAQRFAFHVLRSSNADAAALADSIRALKAALHLCSICNNVTDVDPCGYCTSASRSARLICVVAEPTDIAAIEKTRAWNGLYHVLHGTLSPVNNVGPNQLRLANLWPRLKRLSAESFASERNGEQTSEQAADEAALDSGDAVPEAASGPPHTTQRPEHAAFSEEAELILATSPTVEGEATARYIADEVHIRFPGVRVTRIATGVPAGSDIEYADEVTMTRALENRRVL